jgi:hypothetical protein
MTITWNSLHLSCNDAEAIRDHIQAHLAARGYTLYDPFDTMPTPIYTASVRLFLSPPNAGWTRIIGTVMPGGTLQEALLPELATLGDVVALTLNADGIDQITAYQAGAAVSLDALTTHQKPGYNLHKALNAQYTPGEKSDDVVPMDVLPADVQDMAQNLNAKHINRMFNKLMKSVNKRLGAGQDEAHNLLSGNKPDWTSSGGQRLRAVMTCLTTPPDWMSPGFVTVRDAYQLHRRRQRNPNAVLYPGDAEALAAVPNALDYQPIYGGKSS